MAKRKQSAAARSDSRGRRPDVDPFERSRARTAIVWLVGLKLAVVMLALDPSGAQTFDLPKAALSRAVDWPLAALLAFVVARYGVGVLPRSRLHLVIAAFVAVAALAGVFAEDRYVALYGELARYLGLTSLLDMLVLYAAIATAFVGPRDWAVPYGWFAGASFVAIGYAFVQLAGRDPIAWQMDPRARPFSTFGNPDMFGHFLSTAFAMGLGVAAFGPPRRGVRAIGGVLAAAAVVCAGVVATRATLLGLFGAIGLAPAVYLRLRGSGREAVRRLGLAAALTIIAGVAVLVATPLGERARGTLQGFATQDRVLIYESAIEMIGSRPILGYGPDNFGVAYPRFRAVESAQVFGLNIPQSSAHSWVLQSAATLGLLGLAATLLLIAVFGAVLFSAVARSPHVAPPLLLAFAAYWLNGLLTVGSVAVDWIPWVCMGSAVAIVARRGQVRVRRQAAAGAPLLIGAVAIAGLLAVLPALAANRSVREAQIAYAAKRGDAAIAAAEGATRSDTGRADYWNWLGLSLDLRQRYTESRIAYTNAAERAPHNATYWINLARTEARLYLAGDRSRHDAALAAAQRAIAEDPNEPSWYAALAQIDLALGEYGASLEVSLKAIALYPQEQPWQQAAVDAAIRMNDPHVARDSLERAIAITDTATLRIGLAKLDLALNDIAGAKADISRALELEPFNAEARRISDQLGP